MSGDIKKMDYFSAKEKHLTLYLQIHTQIHNHVKDQRNIMLPGI